MSRTKDQTDRPCHQTNTPKPGQEAKFPRDLRRVVSAFWFRTFGWACFRRKVWLFARKKVSVWMLCVVRGLTVSVWTVQCGFLSERGGRSM